MRGSNRWLTGWIAAGLLLALLPGAAWADDTSLGAVGFAVMPLENTHVTMAAERVEVELARDQSWVTCVFTFTNAGPAAAVLMGFPEMRARPNRREAPAVRDFRAWVDGSDVPVTFRPQAEGAGEEHYAGWHTFEVPFAAGQTRVVRNTYHGRLTWAGGAYGRSFGYVLHTGANWAGPIGQADVVVRWGPREVAEIYDAHPPGYAAGPREMRWHWADLEPTERDDVWMSYYAATSCYYYPNAAVSSGQVRAANLWEPGELFLADASAATAWQSEGEAEGAWVIWAGGGYNPTTMGLGILPGAAGADYRLHGRPKEVLVRLARAAGSPPPRIELVPDSFLRPLPQVEVREYRITLADAPRWQFLRLEEAGDYMAFQIVVESVYPGERYDDVAIAEVLYPVLEEDLLAPPVLPGAGGPAGLAGAARAFLALGAAGLAGGAALRRRFGRPNAQKQVCGPTS